MKYRRTHEKIGLVLFGVYLVLLVYVMFLSEDFGRTGHKGYYYNLVLFREIRRFYEYRETLGMRAFLLNTAGNVVCFLPFGFFLPVVTRFGEKWYRTVLASFLMSLLIETLQLTLRIGSFDVDDMFLNTLGGTLGYIAARILGALVRHRRRERNRRQKNEKNQGQ
jgi:glycopeptide antibiotics resistance protein